jgi:hypothetical protein
MGASRSSVDFAVNLQYSTNNQLTSFKLAVRVLYPHPGRPYGRDEHKRFSFVPSQFSSNMKRKTPGARSTRDDSKASRTRTRNDINPNDPLMVQIGVEWPEDGIQVRIQAQCKLLISKKVLRVLIVTLTTAIGGLLAALGGHGFKGIVPFILKQLGQGGGSG